MGGLGSCRGICDRMYTVKTYIEGAKRCRVCNVFLEKQSVFCVCCHYRLSSRARSNKSASRKLRNKK